jgi:hypothetical protein
MTVLDLVREAFEEFLAEFLSGSSQIEVMDANVRAKMHAFVHKQLQAWKGSASLHCLRMRISRNSAIPYDPKSRSFATHCRKRIRAGAAP